jgi:hypothetical protein
METQRSEGAHPRLMILACAALLASSAAGAQAEPAPPFLILLQQAHESVPRLAESLANIRAAEGQTVRLVSGPIPLLAWRWRTSGSPIL